MNILWQMPTLRRHGCGLSRRAIELAKELQTHGHVVSFVVADGKTDIADQQIAGVPVTRVTQPPHRPIHWSSQAVHRRRAARAAIGRLSDHHDLFITCQPEAVSAYRNMYRRRPILFVCGGTSLLHEPADRTRASGQWFLRRLPFYLDRHLKHRNEAAAFFAADAVVFDSHHTHKLVVDGYGIGPDKCVTLYGGVDTTYYRPPSESQRRSARKQLALALDDIVLTWTGRLSPEKNLELLIHALPRCRHFPNRVFLVGDGPHRERYVALAERIGLNNITTFTGEQADVRPYLHAADLFAFPSRSESCGLSLLEAMACGLPCLALCGNDDSVRNAGEELLGGGERGSLVTSEDPAAFAEAIDDLLGDAARRRVFGERASRFISGFFSWSQAGHKLNELIVRLCARSAGVAPHSKSTGMNTNVLAGLSS